MGRKTQVKCNGAVDRFDVVADTSGLTTVNWLLNRDKIPRRKDL